MCILLYLFSERKFIYYQWLYLIYVLKIGATFTYTLTDCDLIPRCMNKNNISTVEDLSNITCEKSSPCDMLDLSSSSTSQNSLNIALEKLNIIKQDNASSLVQLALAASLPSQLESEGSFLFQISLGEDDICYNFYIPFSLLSSSKKRFVLPCIQLNLSSQLSQRMFVSAYFKEHQESKYEIINLQAAKYVLKESSTVQVLQSGFRNITFLLDRRKIYLTSNVDDEATCPSLYNISIIESNENDLCNPLTQKTVCQWISALKSHHLYLNCNRHTLKSSQTYCIYSYFFAREECKYEFPVETVQMTFFKISPEEFYKDITSRPFCKDWNASIYGNVTSLKKVEVQFFPWHEYDNCFLSYEFHLYTLRSHDCGAGSKSPFRKINVNHIQQGVTKYFTGIPNGNYCFLVIPCDMIKCHRNWSRRYKNRITIEDQVSIVVLPDPTADDANQKHPLYVVIAGVLLLLITVPRLLWSLLKKFRRVKVFDDYEMKQISSPLILLKMHIFHSFDQNILDEVHTFINDTLPVDPHFEVNTPLEEQFDKIYPNPDLWFRNNIKWECGEQGPTCNSKMRLIIVMSDKTLQLINQSDDEPLQMSIEEQLFYKFLKYYSTYIERLCNDHFHVIKVCFEAKFDSESETRGRYQALRDVSSSCYNGIAKLFHCKRSRNACCSGNDTCYNLKSEKRLHDFYLTLGKSSAHREEISKKLCKTH